MQNFVIHSLLTFFVASIPLLIVLFLTPFLLPFPPFLSLSLSLMVKTVWDSLFQIPDSWFLNPDTDPSFSFLSPLFLPLSPLSVGLKLWLVLFLCFYRRSKMTQVRLRSWGSFQCCNSSNNRCSNLSLSLSLSNNQTTFPFGFLLLCSPFSFEYCVC